MAETLDQPCVNPSDVIASHGRHRAAQAAAVCGDETRNWARFDGGISRVAHALIAGSAAKGDCVAIVMGNSADLLEVVFGVIRVGCCAAPLSGILTTEQLVQLIDDSQARALFASGKFGPALAYRAGDMPNVESALRIASWFEADGWTGRASLCDGHPETSLQVTLTPEDEFNIIYSSGTTGLSKGIVQTHVARTHFAFSNAIEMGYDCASRALTTNSLYSNSTWLTMLPCLFAGGTLHAMPAFDVGGFPDTVGRERIPHTFLVFAQYIMMLGDDRLEQADLFSPRTVLSAGSPLRTDTKRGVLERVSAGLFELYGFSEGFANLLKPQQHAKKFHTVGTPVLGFEVAILDEEGARCAPDQPGGIVAYGAGMLREYNRRPDQTADLIWRDERGWSFIRSGYIGAMDADGYLRIIDRKKDMIVTGGFNVFPTDIEAVVGEHPEAADITVIGIPHDKWDETALALIISPRGVTPDLVGIRDWANARLAKHQRMHAVETRTDSPQNALGKGVKRRLRDSYCKDGDMCLDGIAAPVTGGGSGLGAATARQLARHGIRVVSIAPGVFGTPMFDTVVPEWHKTITDGVPFPERAGEPDEFARMVETIALNPIMNGTTARLDGGVRLA